MKLTLSRQALLTAATRVAGIVSRRNTIPILSHALLSADANTLTLRATDLDLQATVTAEVHVEQPGAISAPAGTLLDIAKALPDGAEISIELIDNRLIVKSGRARWKLPTLPAGDFPDMGEPVGGWEWSATISGPVLADTLSRVAWAVSTDAGKEFLNGVRLLVKDGEMIGVATQGRDLAIVRAPLKASDFSGLTIPTRTAQEMAKLCGEGEMTLQLTQGRVGLQGDAVALNSKTLAVDYVAWDRVLTVERTASFSVDRIALSAALSRALIGAHSDATGHSVRLELSTGSLKATGRSADNESADEIEADYEGEDITLGVNAESIANALAMLRSGRATVRFTPGRPAPMLIEVEGDASVVAISANLKVA